MSAQRKQAVESLHVELALFRGNALVQRGNVLLRLEEGYSCFGEHRHMTVGGHDAALFAGLVVQHRLELPASPVTISYFEVSETGELAEPLRQSLVFKSALRVGVHTSDDWEKIALGGDNSLVFRCTEVLTRRRS